MIATGGPLPAHAPVFISFASNELPTAARVVQQLEQGGIRCWISSRDIETGASYPAAITAAVTGASAMLLLLTEASNTSPHVLSEVELAFNARKPILPVRLTAVALSPNLQYFLGTTQWFDAGPDFDDGDAARLQARLRRIFAGESVVDRLRGEATTSKRRVAYMVLGLSLAAIVGAFLLRGQYRPSGTGQVIPTPAAVPAAAAGTRNDERAQVEEKKPDNTAPPHNKEAASPALRTRVTNDGQAYVWIPPGRFTMGCSPGDSECDKDELPAHVVRIRAGFWMSRMEVTNAQYAIRHAVTIAPTDRRLPATALSWADAKGYCASVGGRLPTESEWEYAARANSTSSRYDTLPDIAWYAGNSDDRVHPVGSKTPNAFGLFDMLGNVYEWVADRYYDAYDDSGEEKVVEPLAPNASGVARGGAFTSQAKELRASNRFSLPPDAEEPHVGFRCVADR
jgi:formylglycine-generating enzyme required for sulfatase activity